MRWIYESRMMIVHIASMLHRQHLWPQAVIRVTDTIKHWTVRASTNSIVTSRDGYCKFCSQIFELFLIVISQIHYLWKHVCKQCKSVQGEQYVVRAMCSEPTVSTSNVSIVSREHRAGIMTCFSVAFSVSATASQGVIGVTNTVKHLTVGG